MKKKILKTFILSAVLINLTSISAFALPALDGLQDEEKIQVIDNEISLSIEKINKLDSDIKKNEETIAQKGKELIFLQKEYQVQKKNSAYNSTSFLRTNTKQKDNLRLFETLLNSNSISDFFQKVDLNKNAKFSQNKKAKLLTAQEDHIINLQEKLNKEKEELNKDKEVLGKEKVELENLKKEVQEEIARRPVMALNLEEGLPIQGGASYGGVQAPDLSKEASPKAQAIIQEAFKYLGVPYVWGGTTPNGFDCSGFTQYVFRNNGISLPRVSQAQQLVGQKISIADVQPGDLLFNGYPAYHVSIYIGDGKYIHAPRTGDVVKISTVNWSKVTSISRFI